MDITEVTLMHHVGIVLLSLWFFSYFNWCHPVAYFVSLIYLFLVHERYVMRLQRKLQFEERKQANQRRVLSDSETVRWLNHAVERIWPICMEQIASQKILLPIIPWFLEKYKPWTAKKAVVQHLYLGRNPPMFTEMRILHNSSDDDHLVLELGMNFLTAEDMSAILAVKLRKRLGFGMVAKLHLTGMHVEGKVLIGVKFIRGWPFISRLRVCFAEPPYFQMTIKPLFNHGLDVTEVPGIAGWLDKLLSVAFEQTLVEPNMLVLDMEKFASPEPETWFSMDGKEPIAHAKVEVIEASDMKPSDLNGLADPYIKGQLGDYRFRTKIQRKTLTPKWQEEFKIPIVTWESPNMLVVEVCDKDRFVDDTLGDCSVNISDLRDGQRHDLWLTLQNIKMGRLHLAITVLEDRKKDSQKVDDQPCDKETLDIEDKRNSFGSETPVEDSFSFVTSDKFPRMADTFEPIDIEGQKETGIWVHHPGSDVAQTWEPRKGKNRRIDTEIRSETNGSVNNSNAVASGSLNNDSSSDDENCDDKHRMKSVRRGLRKIGSVFHRSPRTGDQLGSFVEPSPSPHANIRAVNETGVKIVVDNNLCGPTSDENPKGGNVSSDGSNPESPSKVNMKDKVKNFLKHGAGKSARDIKHAISRKVSRSRSDKSVVTERESIAEGGSSEDESSCSPEVERKPGMPEVINSGCGNDSLNSNERVLQTASIDNQVDTEGQKEKVSLEDLERRDEKLGSPDKRGEAAEESFKPELAEVHLEGDKR
ncbi:C2 domain-containing protein At1g53590-like [Quercus robur]|uniref:C2 domain-containing protein At1g53590-like n=1 Tax=Quercus robur TaxID=38942 RepID=UPI0021638DD0|nr:C2 domain-containing protein At1g53590-like [Quercus robur]